MSSAIKSIFGGGGGAGYNPQAATIVNPATQEQANEQYGNVNTGLNTQADFLRQLQAQNGLQNQSNVYNQLQGVANGTGPNPAQAQLAQATGANVANQAALMAGQRGSSANTGLMARQAAQQGANIQQGAAGQAATLQANQSLNALQGMGNMANQQAGQQANATQGYTQNALAAQQNILNSIAAGNNARVGMQSNINNVGGGIAQTVASGQMNMIGNLAGAAGSAAGGLFSNSGNSATASPATQTSTADWMQSPTTGTSNVALAGGGMVPKYAAGGGVALSQLDPTLATPSIAPIAEPSGPQSNVGKTFNSSNDAETQSAGMIPNASSAGAAGGGGAKKADSGMGKLLGIAGGIVGGIYGGPAGAIAGGAVGNAVGGGMAKGGEVPAMVSPGEQYLAPADVKKVEKGANPLSVGEKIPGKAKVKGDSYSNDTVPKTLKSGGIVLPKSVMESQDPSRSAADFVSKIMAKHGKRLPKSGK